MNVLRVTVVVSILGAILALTCCNNSGGETAAAEPEADRQAVTSEPAPGAAAPEATVPAAPGVHARPGHDVQPDLEPSPDHPPARLVATQEQVEAAREEAQARVAALDGGTTCERIYTGRVAMHDVIGDGIPAPPPEAEFMSACNRLPEQVQRCMMPEYGLANQEACRAAHENLEPSVIEDLERINPEPPDQVNVGH